MTDTIDTRQFLGSPPITTIDLQKAVQDAIREVAPLVDAEKVLREWLAHNGIHFAEDTGGVWRFLDNRPGYQGIQIQDTRFTYSEALIFALEFVKSHLQSETN